MHLRLEIGLSPQAQTFRLNLLLISEMLTRSLATASCSDNIDDIIEIIILIIIIIIIIITITIMYTCLRMSPTFSCARITVGDTWGPTVGTMLVV